MKKGSVGLKPENGYSPLGSPGYFKSDDILKNPVIIEVAEKLGKTPAQVALRWGLQAGKASQCPFFVDETHGAYRTIEDFWTVNSKQYASFRR
ncbi:Aldo-keto reductase family 4 member C10 [Spatholobus suberectus]|nr:Aldo-keto reductase family 4 member C10 [Spatholobus suberectus]